MSKFEANYQHYVPEAKLDSTFPAAYQFVVVQSIAELTDLLAAPKYLSFDTETTGLDPEKHNIVGFSFCLGEQVAYYCPVDHADGGLGKQALAIIYNALLRAKKVFLYNARFDMRFMEYAGFNMEMVFCLDVACCVFLADSNYKRGSLKWAARHFLGWDMLQYEEALGDKSNFYFSTPEDIVFYAASDALATFYLAKVTFRFYQEAKIVGHIDMKSIYPLMKYEEQLTHINVSKLVALRKEISERLKILEREIYIGLGRAFNISSPAQLSDALQEAGMITGKYTKSGYMKTSIDLLVQRNEPVAKKIVEYKELFKADSSYLTPLIQEATARSGKIRFMYYNTRVPTGRLASGKDKKNTFFAEINVQSVPKPLECLWYCLPTEEPDNGVDIFFGWKFSLDKISDKAVEGFNPKVNIRHSFEAGEGKVWVSIDYKTQELRIPANLSGEQVWIKSFLNGLDVHTETAKAIFGAVTKDSRQKAKACNFGILYGMSEHTIAERFAMTLDEAKEFLSRYKQALPTLFAFLDRHKKQARRLGVVYTYFGRPRRLKHYFASPEGSMRAFGYRTACNTIIQGCAADILKIAMIHLWTRILNHVDYKQDAAFRVMVHDEINFAVSLSRLDEICRLLQEVMTLRIKGWQVPMEVGVSVGPSWGVLFPFELTDQGWIPVYKTV